MEGRISGLNNQEIVSGDCVVYLMSRDQRVLDNHALLRAQDLAKEIDSKIVVAFNVLSKTGERAKEHYEFMLQGLKAIEAELDKYNIGLTLLFEDNHKSYEFWDIYNQNNLKDPAIIFKVEDRNSEYFEIFFRQINNRYYKLYKGGGYNFDILKSAM